MQFQLKLRQGQRMITIEELKIFYLTMFVIPITADTETTS